MKILLRERLAAEALVFLTHDDEFADIPADLPSQVVISRVPQRMPVSARVEIWLAALRRLAERRPPGRLFEILPSGELVAWELLAYGRRQRGEV